VDALKALVTDKAYKLFTQYNVFTKEELHSRYEIYMEQYCKVINIECKAAIEMTKTQYFPAIIRYTASLAETIAALKSVGAPAKVQTKLLQSLSESLEAAQNKVEKAEAALEKAQKAENVEKQAVIYRDEVIPQYSSLRFDIDTMETQMPKELWPVPTYTEMLFLSAHN